MPNLNEKGSWVTYQGMRVLSCEFSNTPGVGPDSGSITVLIANFDKLDFEILRPMFLAGRAAALGNIAVSDPQTGIVQGDQTKLSQYGTLSFTENGVGANALQDIYIREDGVEELDRFVTTDGKIEVSLVKISLTDEREWWAKRGYVHGVFNKRGADERIIASTLSPNGTPWTLGGLIDLAEKHLPRITRNGILFQGNGAIALNAFVPKEKDARFAKPAYFLSEILDEFPTLMLIKGPGGILHIWRKGEGNDVAAVIALIGARPYKQFVTLSTNYVPDSMTCYAQSPTVQEEVLTLDGRTGLVLKDPTTGAWASIADGVLAKYGMTETDLAKYAALLRFTGHKNKHAYTFALKKIFAHLVATNGADIPPSVRQVNASKLNPSAPGSVVKTVARVYRQVAATRASLLAEHCNRAFRVSATDYHKLPVMDRLIRVNPVTREPLPIHVSLLNYQTVPFNPNEDKDVNPDAIAGVVPECVEYYTNPTVAEELDEGAGTFRMESRTGILLFRNPVGRIAYQDSAGSPSPQAVLNAADAANKAAYDKAYADPSDANVAAHNATALASAAAFNAFMAADPAARTAPIPPGFRFFGPEPAPIPAVAGAGNNSIFGVTSESLYIFPPIQIQLTVAYERHGSRDLRAQPGQRSKFPPDIADINLQYVSSPEDHFLQSFDKAGNPLDNDLADTMYPATQQIPGRHYEPLVPDGAPAVTTIRNAEMGADAQAYVKGRLLSDERVAGRRFVVAGFVAIVPDGIVTQVAWKIDGGDGIPQTTILMGSPRAAGQAPNYAMKNTTYKIGQSAQIRGDGPSNSEVVT